MVCRTVLCVYFMTWCVGLCCVICVYFMSWCVGLCVAYMRILHVMVYRPVLCCMCMLHIMMCRTILCVACVYFMSWCVGLYCVLHVYTSCHGVQDGSVLRV